MHQCCHVFDVYAYEFVLKSYIIIIQLRNGQLLLQLLTTTTTTTATATSTTERVPDLLHGASYAFPIVNAITRTRGHRKLWYL